MSPSALRLAALAAALSAVTTFLLWLLPRMLGAPGGFDAAIALHGEPVYLARLWVNFVHIFLALTAYAATAYVLWQRAPALAGLGFVWLLMWGFAELLGVSVNLFAVNALWRAQYASASPALQEQLRILLMGFDGVWDAVFFLLLVCFLLGSLCYGLAMQRGRGLERALGFAFLLAVPLTAAIIIGGYTSYTGLNAVTGAVYPILQPVARLALAAWLWRVAQAHAEGMRQAKPGT